ncbi:hypothetical protein C4546_04210 [Candidatus Parcubacteria bacterium]|nr:MAG: hypothetical protein C4546_04210 [Candidatus Parcubacteria bacterium]
MTQRRIHQGEFPYFITTNIKGDKAFFIHDKYADLLSKIIIGTSMKKGFLLIAYCIMPDHVHLIVWQDLRSLKTNPARAATKLSNINLSRAQAAVPAIGKILLHPGAGRAARAGFQKSRLDNLINSKVFTISDLMHGIKSYFVRQLRVIYKIDNFSWQARFHAKILNSDESVKMAIKYVQNNPLATDLNEKFSRAPYQYLNTIVYKMLK